MPILGTSSSRGGGTPTAPTSVSATAGNAQAVVSFTASSYIGKGNVTYTAISSPGNITATGTSPITVTGLTNGTAYTFTVRATSSTGETATSSASGSVTPVLPIYTLAQTYNNSTTYTVPSGVTKIAVYTWAGAGSGGSGGYSQQTPNTNAGSGGGGGGGGALVFFEEYAVSAAEVYTVTVGGAQGASWFRSPSSEYLSLAGGGGSGDGGGQGPGTEGAGRLSSSSRSSNVAGAQLTPTGLSGGNGGSAGGR